MDWRVSPARVADVIVRLETEILATQEILLSQADEISKRISVPFIFGVARQHAGEPYGNALFTKLPVVSHENYDLTVIGREQRKCLRVSLLFPEERKVHLFAAHLGTSYTERRKQARQLLSPDILLSARFRTHRIVAGDFNEWTRGLTSQLLSEHLQSADINMHLKRGKTYPGIVPFMHLDHIYYDRDFELLDMHLYRSRLSLMASDHLPLVAKFAV
jgi:endonuclease/exonuclease/phosphatase family metal-dependent hydrolase